MPATLLLIRGLPGSGKSSLLNSAHVGFGGDVLSADDYFEIDGEYKFDPSKLPDAHAWCLKSAKHAIEQCSGTAAFVSVNNTFTQRWEMEPYIQLAKEAGARLVVASLYDGGLTDEELEARNSHGVTLESIKKMRSRFEHDWKNGNPSPPWERGND